MTPFLALVLAGYAVFMVALAGVWLRDQGSAKTPGKGAPGA
jgi:hypothetical protein